MIVHIGCRTQCITMTQVTWPLKRPTICVISRFLTKSIVFQKLFQMSLTAKKADYIFEEISQGEETEQQTELVSTIPQIKRMYLLFSYQQLLYFWLREFINPNLRGGGGNFTLSPHWFSLSNSETVKAITLAFCSIQ